MYRLQIAEKKLRKKMMFSVPLYKFHVFNYTLNFTHTTGTRFPIPHTDVGIQDGRWLPLSGTCLLVNHFDHQFV